MATKSITITEDAYERLASFKNEKESFSDVINKLTRKSSYMDLVGVLSKEEAKELRESIKDVRKRMREDIERTAKRLQ